MESDEQVLPGISKPPSTECGGYPSDVLNASTGRWCSLAGARNTPIESAIATTTPPTTPKTSTAEGDERQRDLGRAERRKRQIESMLISPAAAMTMITPSAAVGSGSIRGIAKRRKSPTTRCGNEDGGLRPCAGGVVDRGSGVGGGDGKRPSQTTDEIGAADRGQLTVCVDLVAMLLRERSHGRDESAKATSANAAAGSRRSRKSLAPTPGSPTEGSPPSTSPTTAIP